MTTPPFRNDIMIGGIPDECEHFSQPVTISDRGNAHCGQCGLQLSTLQPYPLTAPQVETLDRARQSLTTYYKLQATFGPGSGAINFKGCAEEFEQHLRALLDLVADWHPEGAETVRALHVDLGLAPPAPIAVVPCAACQGTAIYHGESCLKCNGEGKVPHE